MSNVFDDHPAKLVLLFTIEDRDDPYFRLAQSERKEIEAKLVDQLAEVIPLAIRERWLALTFPLALTAPDEKVISLYPDDIDSQPEYRTLFFEDKLRELESASFTIESRPGGDDPCFICVIEGEWHVCYRCSRVEKDGKPFLLTEETKTLGQVQAQVKIELSWKTRLE